MTTKQATLKFLEFLQSLAPEGETPLIVRQKPQLKDGGMRSSILLAFPLGLACIFYVGVDSWPIIASKEFLLGIAICFAFIWGGFSLTLPKLTELTSLEGLDESQHRLLADNIQVARRKVWRIGGMSLLCVLSLFFLAAVTTPRHASMIAAFAGLSVGYSIVFIFTYKRWSDEIHQFIAGVNERRLQTKRKQDA